MRTWGLLSTAAVAALLLTPGAGLAGEPPARIAVQAPGSLHPGEAGKLVLSLAGTKGEPTRALQPLPVEIRGAGALGPATATIPAGASSLEVAIHAPKPGLWQIEARSPGLASGFAIVVCIAPQLRGIQRPVTVPEVRAQAVPPPLQRTPSVKVQPRFFPRAMVRRLQPRAAQPPQETAAAEPVPPPVPSAAPAPPPQGHVELVPQPQTVPRGPNGWAGQVEAFWYEGDAPGLIPADLNLSLLVDGGTGEARVAPAELHIKRGGWKSDPATVSANGADTAEVRAVYPGGTSKPVAINFLAAEPVKLDFAAQPALFRGLTSVATDVYVRLLGADGQPAVSGTGRPVTLAVQGPTGTRSYVGSVPAGEMQAKIPIELARPGDYSLVASAATLVSPPLAIRFALDWLLLASALAGGVLGSLTRVLYRRERLWPKGLPRSLALGVAAALLVLLLSLFGVLSILGDALPAAEALQKVSPTSLAGALLLGFLAGLAFDKIFARFLGARPGRKAKPPAPKPPASAPSPPPAPAAPRP